MADHILIEEGCPPWRPTDGTDDLFVLHRFSMPLIGVVRQYAAEYLFWCVSGQASDRGIWAYQMLYEDEVADLEHTDRSQLVDKLSSITSAADRGCVVAWAAHEAPSARIITHLWLEEGLIFGGSRHHASAALRDHLASLSAEQEELRESELV